MSSTKQMSEQQPEHLTEQQQTEFAFAELTAALFTKVDPDKGVSRYSNTVALMDVAPRFLRGRTKVIPSKDAPQSVLRRTFDYQGITHGIEIQPLNVDKEVEGKVTPCYVYPSDREEHVERAILKLAADGAITALPSNKGTPVFYVTFSRYELYTEMQKAGHAISYGEMNDALEILTSSTYKITAEADGIKTVYSGATFPERLTQEKTRGERTDRVRVQLNLLHTQAITNGTYRQYLYSRTGSHKKALSRWLDMYLTHNWPLAGLRNHNTFEVRLSEILSGFGYDRSNGRALSTERRDVKNAFNDLFNAKDGDGRPTPLISKVPRAVAIKNALGDTIDYSYKLEPSEHFIAEQRNALAKAKGLKTLRSKQLDDMADTSLEYGQLPE